MYIALKKIFSKVIPIKFLYKNETVIRSIYSIFYIGNKFECNLCGKKLRSFAKNQRNENLCPNCGSLDRDRRLWKIISTDFLKENSKILDFSPSRSLFHRWKKEQDIKYIASDLSGNFIADVAYDITQIPEKEAKFDLITCFHILEHVIDDVKAMTELYRVLKPSGTVLIQTPFKEGEIYEDYNITSEMERLKHFGQEDHVRVYSITGLKSRLEKVGFKVEVKKFQQDLYLGLIENETILIVNK